ncbi:hypothetical protein BCT30_14810 [Enterovibrio norvegicus]|uniref:Lipoprotein n=2 Tax=Enterovibrio norvegicus TaxID=188144 RepID=A0A1I5WYF1_9GAMM|nr:hypothetical protein [Enterovibrio norvegicus]MCC4796901.1 hypothetical protein [Enterovibrio norvegicus]OEE65145.1 hypothetical protein A1OS_15075 [Enterovibrio norvegicus]OEF48569.1 hypothetical protein A1OW_15000 [Enterovibrio norvegicus]OEF57923.1 hypothetical protein A1OU_06870 [Enterovibrio norvegicus]PMH71884.1 hypothetical protein BCU62_24290 [Enterovibrio norvegicus]
MIKPMVTIGLVSLLAACSSAPDPMDERIEAAIKLCQSDSAKAFSNTVDGLRVMCHSGSSYIIRGDISLDKIVELDRVYCSSMGIRDFVSTKDEEIKLSCNDGSNYVL